MAIDGQEMLVEPSVVTTHSEKDQPVNGPVATASQVLEVAPSTSIVAPGLTIDGMLVDLPTAHRELPIGHRLAGQNCHGTTRAGRVANPVPRVPRIRFVYFPVTRDTDHRAGYHRHLVVAEVLLDRVLAARAAGRRPIMPALDYAAEARATLPPPRELFHVSNLEYHRWYDSQGNTREQPLTQERLAAEIAQRHGVPLEEARHRAAHHSHALPAADQAWLLDRRQTPPAQRPLNQVEFQQLIAALEETWHAPAGEPHLERANRQIAMRVAALLGGLLDEFVASPFSVAALGDAFSEVHFAHLRQFSESSRRAEAACGVLLAGPKAWFAAKAARMRAEHQVGLAMSPPTIVVTSAPARAATAAAMGSTLRGPVNAGGIRQYARAVSGDAAPSRSAG